MRRGYNYAPWASACSSSASSCSAKRQEGWNLVGPLWEQFGHVRVPRGGDMNTVAKRRRLRTWVGRQMGSSWERFPHHLKNG